MEKPKMKRAITQKYDMQQLHALTAMENRFLAELATIYKIDDPDDLPVSIDVLGIFNGKPSERKNAFMNALKDAPSNCDELINTIVEEMNKLDGSEGN